MPTSARRPQVLLDTSVAVALVVEDHAHHQAVLEDLGGRRLGLAGHAAFETFSVLTRLPSPARLTPAAASRALAVNFPAGMFLGAASAAELLSALPRLGIAGGAVYDALVGAAAKEHGITLATRDQRAVEVYRALDVDLVVIG
jgi:predicted nucleic acid-binding protein